MNIGFTGTRKGMTNEQKAAFKELLHQFNHFAYHTFHHGDCVGADDEAADMAHELGYTIVAYPPNIGTHRAFNDKVAIFKGSKPYLERNRDIVDACDVLIGTPGVDTWQPRGGTFYTMDYAKKNKVPVYVIWPNGTVEEIKPEESTQ